MVPTAMRTPSCFVMDGITKSDLPLKGAIGIVRAIAERKS
jgi:hypothetical protein